MALKNFAKTRLPRLLRQGILLGLTLAPGGIAAGALRYVTWKPLRWAILWGLEPLLRRGFARAAARYRTRAPQTETR